MAPFGPRRVIGVVTGVLEEDGDAAQGRELKDVLDVIDESPLAPTPLLDLAAWIAEHYLAPPGECYRLILPPDGVRASRAVARLLRRDAPPGDAVVDALRDGPLRVSTLSRRLGGDPASRLARLRRSGVVAVEQDLAARGFRHLQVAVRTDLPFSGRGQAQAAGVRRLEAAGAR